MHRKLLGAALCALLPLAPAQAAVDAAMEIAAISSTQSPLTAVAAVVKKAITALSPEEAAATLQQSITLYPAMTEALLIAAIKQGLNPSLAVTAATRANPSAVAMIVKTAIRQRGDPVAMVSAATSGAPEQAKQIITTVLKISPITSEDSLTIAAIGAGADATAITSAPAAGNPNPGALPPGLSTAPGQGNPIVRPPNFSRAGGNGNGGGIASPS